jgi:3-methyladenine DNA glycosylase AlkD
MPLKKRPSRSTGGTTDRPPVEVTVAETVAWLKRTGTKETRDGMARYAIPSGNAFGVTVAALHGAAKRLGRDHELAEALWESGWYEARVLATFVDEPARVTPSQMDRWCRDFDSWAICDSACFHLFDRTAHAWRKTELWSHHRDEFVKRAAFALLAGLSVHDKRTGDAPFAEALALVEREAGDNRNFVKKAVNWALRSIGKRSPVLHAAATEVAERLATSSDTTARWIGRDALRDLASAATAKRLARRTGA